MRASLACLLLVTGALALGASGALAHGMWAVPSLVAGASARAVAGDLRTAQAQVDASLKQRKKRFAAWQSAAAARDDAAQKLQAMKRAGAEPALLEDALARALLLDERAARARSSLLAAEADVAAGGAELLRRYDAVLLERRRAVEALAPTDVDRGGAVLAYRELAAQRDAVRRALLPVLRDGGAAAAVADPDLEARADDDVEALLAKADLARDLEDRALRQATTIARRVRELEEERAVARDVSGMVGRSQLFDEEDRRLLVVRQDLQAASATGLGARPNAPAEATDEAPSTGDDASGPPVGPSLTTTAPTNSGAFVQTEQAFFGPQTDASIAGMLSSSAVSLDELVALERVLRARAASLRQRSQHLKAEARTRASD